MAEETQEGSNDTEDEEAWPSSKYWRILFGVLIFLFAACASYAVILARRAQPPALLPGSMLLAPITNHTGDSGLDGVVSAGLELALQQSPHVALVGSADYAATAAANGIPDNGDVDAASAQAAAKSAGASALLTGDIRVSGAAYSILVRTVDSQTGKRLEELRVTAPDKSRIPAAIDDLAAKLRSRTGEDKGSIASNTVPLSRSATANLEALRAYASGEKLQAGGNLFGAMYAFEHAVSLEPQFVQAHLHLAHIFLHQHAEVSAADAAAHAVASAGSVDDRTRVLAQAISAVSGEEDYAKAVSLLQPLNGKYPYDTDILDSLAYAQRLQGDFAGSLATSRSVLGFAPRDKMAIASSELALVALDRTNEAGNAVASQAASGVMHGGAEILVAYLRSGDTDAQASPDDLNAQVQLASVLDAGGQFRDGFSKWKEIAAHASSVPELRSAAAYALAQGALDHALGSDCPGSLALLQSSAGLPSGPAALFAMGAAAGLCNDTASARKSIDALNSAYAQTFAARSFYLTDLNALMLWKSGQYADALVALGSANDYDSMSLTPYLRGLVYLAQRQPQLATVEYQATLRHRGAAALVSPELYPAAQIEAARAYGANGDSGNAAQSYNRFLALWPHADPDSVMLLEARSGAAR